MKIQTLLLTLFTALTLCAGENLAITVPWRIACSGGGKMTADRQGGEIILEKASKTGGVIYLPRKDIPIVSGKTYEAFVRFRSLDSGAKAAIMVQTNDVTRRPFPSSGYKTFTGKAGVAAVRITARDTEKTIRIMITMSGSPAGKIAIENVELNEVEPDSDLLKDPSIRWGNRVRGGATGKVIRHSDNTITINRTNDNGQVLIVNDSPINLNPGSEYTVNMTVAAGKDPASARMVMQYPGSKRRAHSVPVQLSPGEEGVATYTFVTKADEKLVKIHLYLDTVSTVKVKKIDLIEKKKHLN